MAHLPKKLALSGGIDSLENRPFQALAQPVYNHDFILYLIYSSFINDPPFQSIFSAPDIQRQLPAEAKMFMTVDKSWKDIMRKVYKVPLALRATTQPGLLETFQNNNTLLDQIMKVGE